ncbi:hypothetical protein L6452_19503 [Arctium lappa]|uniref:Uncharacterized protein n=1 Tax=Arctium lappa TaxID=4217 RepID=A0ACB9B8B9_ARCLA|nr:hypothetical protein L6452_19503 [Arctium lappa]
MFAGSWAHIGDVLEEHYPRMMDHLRRTLTNKYADMMRDARNSPRDRALAIDGVRFDGHDYTVLSAHNLEWIRHYFWVEMIDQVWNTDAFRRVSAVNTANRATEYEGMTSRHYTGSISIAMHRDRMVIYHPLD